MATYILTIPGWHPSKVNEYRNRHWSVGARMRKRAEIHLATAALVGSVPRATTPRRVKLVLSGWARGGPFPDRDAHEKHFLDAMCACGLLVDDSPRWLVGRVEVEYQRGRKETTVILEDC